VDPSNPKDELEALPDFGSLSDDDLKSLIDRLERAENDVSFRRRLLQGRIDILRAERTARLQSGGRGGSNVDLGRLTDILASRATPDSGLRPEEPETDEPQTDEPETDEPDTTSGTGR